MKAFALAAALALSACATSPVSEADARPVPNDRIFDPIFLIPTAGSGEVLVTRDFGFYAMGCNMRVTVDNQPVADLATSEKVMLHLPEGIHIMGTRSNCRGREHQTLINVRAGGRLNYRIGFNLP